MTTTTTTTTTTTEQPQTDAQPSRCPMQNHNNSPFASSSSSSSPPSTTDDKTTKKSKCPINHPTLSALNPLNNIPAHLSQAKAEGQKVNLPTDRTVSSIPRGKLTAEQTDAPVAEGEVRGGTAAYGEGDRWEYPSPQQFYNALKRKGWETPEEHVETMVDIHNFLNEGAWDQVLKWEAAYDCECSEPRSLLKFQGRPKDLSPKARWMTWMHGAPKPFDRHDWIVDRCGKPVRYVIDYYSAPPVDDDTPVFNLDVRPALDSPSAVLQRSKVGFWNAYRRFTGTNDDGGDAGPKA